MAVLQFLQSLNRRPFRLTLAAAAITSLVAISLVLLSGRLNVSSSAALPFSFLTGDSSDDLVSGKEGEEQESPYYEWETGSSFSPVHFDVADTSVVDSDLCASFPHQRIEFDIQPVLKLGYTEPADRARGQFQSSSNCIRDLLVFSDRDGVSEFGHPIIDVLNDLPQSYFEDNDQLANYTINRAAWNKGFDEGLDEQGNALPELRGWQLDKYKFLTSVERAWMMRPGKKWYLFYESDTYVVWDNIFRLIDNFDADTPLYFGSASPGRTNSHGERTWFGNGGPGHMLSRAAMEKLLNHKRGKPNSDGTFAKGTSMVEAYRDDIVGDCCGDSILGWALYQAGIELSSIWPMWGSASLHSINFGGMFWCQPILTMHRTKPADMVKLWRWEHGMRTNKKPLLYSDFFEFHHNNTTPSSASDWDNCCADDWRVSELQEGTPIDDLTTCSLACDRDDSCVQYRWQNSECILMRTARYGEDRLPKKPVLPPIPTITDKWGKQKMKELNEKEKEDRQRLEEEIRTWDYEARRFFSGWRNDRIQDRIGGRECEVVQWERPSLSRIF